MYLKYNYITNYWLIETKSGEPLKIFKTYVVRCFEVFKKYLETYNI